MKGIKKAAVEAVVKFGKALAEFRESGAKVEDYDVSDIYGYAAEFVAAERGLRVFPVGVSEDGQIWLYDAFAQGDGPDVEFGIAYKDDAGEFEPGEWILKAAREALDEALAEAGFEGDWAPLSEVFVEFLEVSGRDLRGVVEDVPLGVLVTVPGLETCFIPADVFESSKALGEFVDSKLVPSVDASVVSDSVVLL